MVRDVGPGAVAGEETGRGVAETACDGVDPAGVDESEGVEAVVVRSGEAVFRGEAVVDRDYNGGDLTGEAATDDVVGLIVRSEEGESATVEEDNDGEIPATGGIGRDEEADPEIAGGIDGDVDGSDVADRVRVRSGAEIDE